MNEQTNRSRIFDFFLLLLAFFSVIGLIQRFGSFGVDAKDAVSDYPVEVLWESVDAKTADCLSTGGNVEERERYGFRRRQRDSAHPA